jgi:hypothetical protein
VIIFLFVVAITATTVFSMTSTGENQKQILAIAASENSADLLLNALVNLPECFGYEKDGRKNWGMLDQAKIDEGEAKADCVSLGPIIWRVKYGDMEIGNKKIGNDFQKDRQTLVNDNNKIESKVLSLYLGSKDVEFEVEEYGIYEYSFNVNEIPGFTHDSNSPILEATIINMTDYSEGCREIGADNIYTQTLFNWYKGSRFTGAMNGAQFAIREENAGEIPYKGNVTNCGIRFSLYLGKHPDKNAFEKSVIMEL